MQLTHTYIHIHSHTNTHRQTYTCASATNAPGTSTPSPHALCCVGTERRSWCSRNAQNSAGWTDPPQSLWLCRLILGPPARVAAQSADGSATLPENALTQIITISVELCMCHLSSGPPARTATQSADDSARVCVNTHKSRLPQFLAECVSRLFQALQFAQLSKVKFSKKKEFDSFLCELTRTRTRTHTHTYTHPRAHVHTRAHTHTH